MVDGWSDATSRTTPAPYRHDWGQFIIRSSAACENEMVYERRLDSIDIYRRLSDPSYPTGNSNSQSMSVVADGGPSSQYD